MSAGSAVWKTVKAHVPLIKFRKGIARPHTAPTSSEASSNAPKIGLSARGTGIDDMSLPKRYQRKQMTGLEMEVIERGGPDKF